MSDDDYSVVLKGYQAGKGEYYVEEAFAKLFKITADKAKQLLNSAPTVIKENLPLEKANQYKKAIDQTGASCEVENTKFNTGGLSLE
ncbi:MAG: ribosomal protein L7/L12 [Gammaproteobacteria bacterium]